MAKADRPRADRLFALMKGRSKNFDMFVTHRCHAFRDGRAKTAGDGDCHRAGAPSNASGSMCSVRISTVSGGSLSQQTHAQKHLQIQTWRSRMVRRLIGITIPVGARIQGRRRQPSARLCRVFSAICEASGVTRRSALIMGLGAGGGGLFAWLN